MIRHALYPVVLPKPGGVVAGSSLSTGSARSIGAHNDAAEQEADGWADQIQPKDAPSPGQADPEPGVEPSVSDVSDLVIGQGGGQPLSATVRGIMESRFGHDFSHVRIHADTAAAESARAIDAKAYTNGSHIVFAESRFAPESHAGRRLLAHELAHVVQQRNTAPAAIQRKPEGKRFYSLEEMYGESDKSALSYLYPQDFTFLRRDSALIMRAIWHAGPREGSVTFEYLLGRGPHGSAIPNLVREFFYRLVFRNVGLKDQGAFTLKLRFVRTGLGLGRKSGERKIAEARRYLNMFLNNKESLKRNSPVPIKRVETSQAIGTSGKDASGKEKEIRVPVTELVFKIPEFYQPTFPATPAEQRLNRRTGKTL